MKLIYKIKVFPIMFYLLDYIFYLTSAIWSFKICIPSMLIAKQKSRTVQYEVSFPFDFLVCILFALFCLFLFYVFFRGVGVGGC